MINLEYGYCPNCDTERKSSREGWFGRHTGNCPRCNTKLKRREERGAYFSDTDISAAARIVENDTILHSSSYSSPFEGRGGHFGGGGASSSWDSSDSGSSSSSYDSGSSGSDSSSGGD